jgi:hypothetical protein
MGFKAWPRSSAQSYKDEVNTFNMIEDHHKYSNRASRQPWLSSYLPSVEAKASSRVEQCILEGDGFVRVCAHCGTSKTPLWRNGPGGPKVTILSLTLKLSMLWMIFYFYFYPPSRESGRDMGVWLCSRCAMRVGFGSRKRGGGRLRTVAQTRRFRHR